MSLFEGLSVGNRGLAASQLAINVTGQNISNANTEGYSRKRLGTVADYREDGAFGQMGFGVDVRYIERVRNIFIDRQLNTQLSDKGYTESVDYTYERLENIHQEPGDTGITQAMDEFWNAWSDLANNPGDKSSREALKSTATVMTERFHYTAAEIRSYKLSINDQIAQQVEKVNDIATKISELNGVIMNAEGLDTQNANDSRDLRDQLLKELSDIVKISTVEDERGAVTVTLSGSMLVSPGSVYKLETVRESITEADGFKFSFYTMRFEGASESITAQGGRLKALFDARDEIIPKYENELNAMAETFVSRINENHVTGYSLYHMTGIEFFDSTKVSASNIKISAALEEDSNNIAASVGGNLTPVTSHPVIRLAGSDLIDLTNVATGGNVMFRNVASGSMKLVRQSDGREMLEGADKDYVLDYEGGRIRFNPAAVATPIVNETYEVTFKYNDSGFSGVGDGKNAIKISMLRDAKLMDSDSFGNYTHTVSEFFSGYIGRLGVERNQASSELETQKSLVEQLSGQQQEISGVNLDEEMSNLIRYQHCYQASARFIRTIGDMLEVLMSI